MAPGKSAFHRFALKQKLALARKMKAVGTLQEELDRTALVRDQLAEMAGQRPCPSVRPPSGTFVPQAGTAIRCMTS